MKKHVILMMTALAVGISPSAAKEQFGAITGTVQDQAKRPVEGALITATNTADSTTETTLSTADGSYRIQNVKPGMYSVMAESTAFRRLLFLR